MYQWKSSALFGLIFSLSFLTACSNNSQFLKSMDLSVTEQNNESFVNLSSEIDLGNLALDALEVPVLDPHSGKELGQITLGAGPNGKEQVKLSLNTSALLTGDSALGAALPNGRPLPSSLGLTSGQVLAIPVLNYSRVYIGGDLKTSIVVGVALAVKALDQVTGSIGLSANIFFSQVFNPNLSGVAGIYASGTTHQNGIAVFGKFAAGALAPPAGTVPQAGSRVTSASVGGQVATKSRMFLKSRMPDESQPAISADGISVRGVTPMDNGNLTLNEGMPKAGEEKLYRYFYGKKRMIRPH